MTATPGDAQTHTPIAKTMFITNGVVRFIHACSEQTQLSPLREITNLKKLKLLI
jgi:hypothetical protein